MPFDGVFAYHIAQDLNKKLAGGRIGKVYQPDRDSIVLLVRANTENYRLLFTSNAACPRVQVTQDQYENPDSPPVFCMFLRKHLSGGIIRRCFTDGFERIVCLEVEVTDELGDRSLKKLIIEIMGRHSNIILLNKDDRILDAIKHVDSDVNRVRELLPARPYVLPPAQNKLSPSDDNLKYALINAAANSGRKLESFLLDNLQGFSPSLCREICFRAGLDELKPASSLSQPSLEMLADTIGQMMLSLQRGSLSPNIVYDQTGKPVDFHIVPLTHFGSMKAYASISDALDAFYAAKYTREVQSQRYQELHKAVVKLIEKCEKRLDIQVQSLEENKSYDHLRLFGELITANIYRLSKGMESVSLENYYSETQEMVEIPLNKDKLPQDNAKIWFRKYTKAKKAYAYAESQLKVLKDELAYLESILVSIEQAAGNEPLLEIKQELIEQGYWSVPAAKGRKIAPIKATPLRVVSKDGFEIFIGRNNIQNDRLTLKASRKEDTWLHIKNFAGSHVVIRAEGREVPDSTLLEAASYAAWFSKARSASKAEVDYTQIRNVKKPSGAKPGMVIYVNYYTVLVAPLEPKIE